jgi:imidazole glycerol-phosphate synthase subunit HisH
MITIIDYGLGNIMAFVNIYKRLNIAVSVAKTAVEAAGATKLILPGVGAFDSAMTQLEASGMHPTLDELVLRNKIPVLGICVGMQILADSSQEGNLPGLGWITGKVLSFKTIPNFNGLPLPHMGWNDVSPTSNTPLFVGLERQARFYFLHSYFLNCGEGEHAIASAQYGIDFCCAVQSENVFGVQFHPEKSHQWGIQLLKNFAEI